MTADKPMRIQLVGAQQLLASDTDSAEGLRFYGSLFDRLPGEAKNTSELTRYVGYQSRVGAERYLHFLGIEVEQIAGIPDGMIAWDLGDNMWSVWEPRQGRDVVVAQQRITWRWLAHSPSSAGGRPIGEWVVADPGPSSGAASTAGHEFWVSAHAYIRPHAQPTDVDDVHLADYDPSWPQQFAEFASWLVGYLGPDIALRVEHFGSTAIPGMPAKPIIDVMVEIPSFSEGKQRVLPLLSLEEWEYWWNAGHMVFIKRQKLMGQRTHHVHMAPRGHDLWERLAFRDYLRSHPQEASRYAALKVKLASAFRQDRERYTEAKTEFVRRVTARALASTPDRSESPV